MTESRREGEPGEKGASWVRGVVRFLQAVKRTVGEATTFVTRLENLPWL